jgi:hypothetical protein
VAAAVRTAVRLLAMLPMAVPGLVLGLAYIFFFNQPANPLNGLYHTLTLLTLCTIVHFYTTGHLTAVTALKALDPEFEAVSRFDEGAVLQDLLARHAAHLHAGPGGHRALLLHQRDDHHLGRGLPVLARDQAGGHRHPEPRRGR